MPAEYWHLLPGRANRSKQGVWMGLVFGGFLEEGVQFGNVRGFSVLNTKSPLEAEGFERVAQPAAPR